ncbi:hypothetical protein EHM76_06980, partial [bacterium]
MPPAFLGAAYQGRRYTAPASLIKGDGTDLLAVRVYFNDPGNGGFQLDDPEPVRSGPFDTLESPGQRNSGYVIGGTGWYRKHFTLPASTKAKKISLRFDGVYMDADFWLNGRHLGSHPYGYTSFAYDLGPHLNPPG